MHGAIDFRACIGMPVYASADGEIISQGTTARDGMEIFMRHFGDDGLVYFTQYSHLSDFVLEGPFPKNVARGQFIGRTGDTGVPGQPHLHFGFRRGQPIVAGGPTFPGGLFNDANPIDAISCFNGCPGGQTFSEGFCNDGIDGGGGPVIFPF